MTKNKKQNREQTKRKKNEVCLLFPNFKPASNQTKIQKKKINYFHYKKYQKNKIEINKCIKIEKKNKIYKIII